MITNKTGWDRPWLIWVFFADLNDWAEFKKVYALYFTSKPARTPVQVARLPLGLAFEVDVIALA